MENVNLKDLIVPESVVWVDFDGFPGLAVQLNHVSREKAMEIRNKCVKLTYNKRTRDSEETLDEDKFLEEFSKTVIKGWRGFKFRYLEEFLIVDLSGVDPDQELPYTEENALDLLRRSNLFDEWVNTTLQDLRNFTKGK